MIRGVIGFRRIFLLRVFAQIKCMRLQHQAGKFIIHQKDHVGKIQKTNSFNKLKKVVSGSEKMGMEYQGGKIISVKQKGEKHGLGGIMMK